MYKTVTTSSLLVMQEHGTQAVTQLVICGSSKFTPAQYHTPVHTSSIPHSKLHPPVHILIPILMLILALTYH